MASGLSVQQALQRAMQHHQAGQLPQAESLYRQILSVKPDHAESLHLLGALAIDVGNPTAGKDLIERAIRIDPRQAVYHGNLALAQFMLEELDASIASAEKALALSDGELVDAWLRLGNASRDLGKTERAREAFEQVLKLSPGHPLGMNNLANVLHLLGRLDEAITLFHQLLAKTPEWAMARANLGFTLLFKGEFENGWAEYEHRLDAPELKQPRGVFKPPRWKGESLDGKRILIYSDQGFGDAFQALRYIPLLAARYDVRISFGSQPELAQLVRGVQGISEVITDLTGPQEYDFHSALMSLPFHFRTTLDSIPSNVPYIQAEPSNAKKWKDRLDRAAKPGLRVGLAWQGRKYPMGRSIPFQLLAERLLPDEEVQFVSLQKGGTAANHPRLLDFTAELTDFAETAALIANLDLVIANDTAVAHLAGAMGKPVWVMLQRVPDWRWLMDRGDSLWYPTMKLFRQKAAGDWTDSLAGVAEALKLLTEHEKRRPA